MLETRLESEIETNYINFQHKNEWKRKEIQVDFFGILPIVLSYFTLPFIDLIGSQREG